MSMVRISASMRDDIVSALLNKKYLTEDAELDRLNEVANTARDAMTTLCYEAAYNAATRKMLTEAAPGMFPIGKGVTLRIEKAQDNYFEERFSLGEEGKPIPFRNYHGGVAAVVTTDSAFFKAYEAWKTAKKEADSFSVALFEKKKADKARVIRVVESVTTVKRLLEIWPEVQDFLPEENSGKDGGLPAEIIADLNKSFGLGG